jgi:ribonuclease HII
MGPLVVAAIRVTDEKALERVGARDSKVLTRKRREELFEKLEDIGQVATRMLSAEDIDEQRKTRTMNEIEMDLFGQVVKELYKKGDRVFVDAADVREEFFGQTIAGSVGEDVDMTSKHKGDAIYPVVSAASIVAKVIRDRLVKEIEAWLRQTLDEPLGSGYPSDPITIEFMENWIKQEGNLPPHTRRSWETAKRLLTKVLTPTLDAFEGEDQG